MKFLFKFIGKLLLPIYAQVNDIGLAVVLMAVLFQVMFTVISHKAYKAIKTTDVIEPIMHDIRQKYKNKPDLMKKELTSLAMGTKYPLFGTFGLYLVQIIIVVGLVGAIQNASVYISSEVSMQSILVPDVSVSLFGMLRDGMLNSADFIMYLIFPAIAVLFTYSHDQTMKQHMLTDVNSLAIGISIAVAVAAIFLPQAFAVYWTISQLVNLLHILFVKQFGKVPVITRKKT